MDWVKYSATDGCQSWIRTGLSSWPPIGHMQPLSGETAAPGLLVWALLPPLLPCCFCQISQARPRSFSFCYLPASMGVGQTNAAPGAQWALGTPWGWWGTAGVPRHAGGVPHSRTAPHIASAYAGRLHDMAHLCIGATGHMGSSCGSSGASVGWWWEGLYADI